MMQKKSLLFITRKFPPQTGGMENLCYHLYLGLQDQKKDMKLVSLGKKQLHLFWFFPYTVFYTILHAHKYRNILLGDGLLCFVGIVSKILAPKTKRFCIVHGLDILFSNRLYQLYLKWFLKKSSDIFICNSTATEELMHERGIMNTVVITPGIDVSAFAERCSDNGAYKKKQGMSDDSLLMITVGRLVKRKGVAWFVDQVMPVIKEKKIYYYIIGTGEMEKEINTAIAAHHLEQRVKLLGRVSDEELAEVYSGADVFIMPNIPVSGDLEGFGIVAIEASLHKLIVVASGIEGIKDAIIDHKNGYLLESGNARRYIETINDIYTNREKYQKCLNQFSEYTKEHYSWAVICKEYIGLLQ